MDEISIQDRDVEVDPRSVFAESESPLQAGSCLLKNPINAEIVQNALMHFEGVRYYLNAWCIMPNHVHVIVTPIQGHKLSAILHSWKSYTATCINRRMGRVGPLWERESFDHVIRTRRHCQKFKAYIENNPVDAGFCLRPSDWKYSHAGVGFQSVMDAEERMHQRRAEQIPEFKDPRNLPFQRLKSRGELPHLHKPGVTYFVIFRLRDAVSEKGER